MASDTINRYIRHRQVLIRLIDWVASIYDRVSKKEKLRAEVKKSLVLGYIYKMRMSYYYDVFGWVDKFGRHGVC